MELVDKIINALREPLDAEYIRLDTDDGVSGFVVSSKFEGISSLDRQSLIEDALLNADDQLSTDEYRQVLMIAGITPLEYASVGAQIRVHQVKTLGGDSLKILLRGGYSDAKYVQGVFNNLKGVKTSEPKPEPGAEGILMKFDAKGTEANPLTKEIAIRILEADQYIELTEAAALNH